MTKMRITILRGEGDLKFIFPCRDLSEADLAAAWLSKISGFTVQLSTYEHIERAVWHDGMLARVS